jgi:hypothetical protein
VGAIAVADADPNVVYVGMGESCIRGNFSHGDGVYKSADAGKTWKRVGLEDSRIIGRIRIHPKNPDWFTSRRSATRRARMMSAASFAARRWQDLAESFVQEQQSGRG